MCKIHKTWKLYDSLNKREQASRCSLACVSCVGEDTSYVEQVRTADKIRRCLELLESLFAGCHFLFYVSPLKYVIE